MDMIDILGPGLYEAVITDLGPDVANVELVRGDYLFALERRTLADIRTICQPIAEDDRRFATAARLSDVNLALYQNTLGPVVRALSTEQSAEQLRRLHPNRLSYEMFSDRNPMMTAVEMWADLVRANRAPAKPDNPLLKAEHLAANAAGDALESMTRVRDRVQEAAFLAIYGSPLVQALAGLGAGQEMSREPERDLARETAEARVQHDALARLHQGGPIAAALRALVYVISAAGSVDERGFAVLVEVAAHSPALQNLGFAGFKDLLRDQQLIMRLEPKRGLEALPAMLGTADKAARQAALQAITRIATVGGPLSPEGQARLDEVAGMFGANPTPTREGEAAGARSDQVPAARHARNTKAAE